MSSPVAAPLHAPFAIETRGLARRFPGGHGVFDLDLAVPEGSVYGFLGPNGAGKTTTIRLLLSLLRPSAGSIRVCGAPVSLRERAALAKVGALVEMPSLYGHLTGRENLEVTRRLIGVDRLRVGSALDQVDLAASADRLVRHYSLGMRQRLALALALLGEPRILILDEPTNGLDPAGIQELRHLLRRLAAERGTTVFLSSHLLAEIEQVSTHLGVLDRGRLIFQGSPAELRRRAPPRLVVDCAEPARAARELGGAGEAVVSTSTDGEGGHGRVVVALGGRSSAEVNRCLVERGIAVSRLAVEELPLEALFLELTGGGPGPR
jgi:ABC-type multidrug transport system ATPase subunit